MTRTRIHNLSMSLDGFATGEGQAPDAPFGHAGHRLHEWMIATRFGAPIVGREGGTVGVDNAFAQQHEPGIGAEIMGAGKFGPPGWQDDADWRGWWGPNPPFHTPKIGRASTRLNSSHANISYAVFCLKKKKKIRH